MFKYNRRDIIKYVIFKKLNYDENNILVRKSSLNSHGQIYGINNNNEKLSKPLLISLRNL